MQGAKRKVVVIDYEFMKTLVKYALTHCEQRCPAERDPKACIALAELLKALGLPPPPCTQDYGELNASSFRKLVKEIEERRGKKIEDFLSTVRREGAKSLQDQIDEIDGAFALEMIKEYKELGNRKIVEVREE